MIESPGVNLHSPGPIGDVAPALINATSITATNTAAPQANIFYVIGVGLTFTIGSGGRATVNQVGNGGDSNGFAIAIEGSNRLFLQDYCVFSGSNQFSQFCTQASGNYKADFPRYGVDSAGTGSAASGISDGGATGCVGFVAAGTRRMLLTTTLFTSTVAIKVPGGTAPVLGTTSAVTSGGAASIGTLTNAPSAGNPTKWIPFDDNGVTRYFPAW